MPAVSVAGCGAGGGAPCALIGSAFTGGGGVVLGGGGRGAGGWVGAYDSIDVGDVERDRVVCRGRLDGKCCWATMLVDGDGRAHGMMGCRQFRSLVLARDAMLQAH